MSFGLNMETPPILTRLWDYGWLCRDSVKLAAMKAQMPIKGCVMASDAFFPFRDGLDAAAQAGITAVIQPGGSIRDAEIIKAADEQGVAMIMTGMRHFRH